MGNRTSLTLMIQHRVHDEDGVLARMPGALDDALSQALQEYSRRLPYVKTAVLTGDGSTILFAVPTDWQLGWSHIVTVEYPAGADEPTYLSTASWSLYQNTDNTLKIRLLTAPASGETARVRYTTVHSVGETSASTSVPSIHDAALATLAASYACQMLAVHFAAQSDSSFVADTTDHSGRSQRYADRAKDLMDRFNIMLPDPQTKEGARRQYVRVVRV